MEYLNIIYIYIYIKNRILKVKNSLLELAKDFKQLKYRELRDTKIQIRKEIEELYFKPINIYIYIDIMDKFEEKGLTKKTPLAKST